MVSRQIHGHPLHLTVVQPPELSFQPLPERNHRPGRIRVQEAANGLIEGGDPHRVQMDAACGVREVVVQPVSNLDGHWVLESADARRGGATPEVPQQRLRHPGQIHRDPLHAHDRNAVTNNCR